MRQGYKIFFDEKVFEYKDIGKRVPIAGDVLEIDRGDLDYTPLCNSLWYSFTLRNAIVIATTECKSFEHFYIAEVVSVGDTYANGYLAATNRLRIASSTKVLDDSFKKWWYSKYGGDWLAFKHSVCFGRLSAEKVLLEYIEEMKSV